MSDNFQALIQAIKDSAGDIQVTKAKAGSSHPTLADGISLAKSGLVWCCFQNRRTGEVEVLDGSTPIYSLDLTLDGIEFTASKILRDFNYESASVTEKMHPKTDA